MEQCGICFESDEKVVGTACGHTFHPECLKLMQKPVCPHCRKDISEELVDLGLDKEDVDKMQRREKYQKFCDNVEAVGDEISTYSEFIELALEAYSLAENGAQVYLNLLIDKLRHFSNKFYQLYNASRRVENGIFYYHFFDIKDFISYFVETNNVSRLKWLPFKDVGSDKKFSDIVNLQKEKKFRKNHLYFCYEIDDLMIGVTEVRRDAYQHCEPLSRHEIQKSLMYCDNRRCDCDKSDIFNKEYSLCSSLLYDKSKEGLKSFAKHSFEYEDKRFEFLSMDEMMEMMSDEESTESESSVEEVALPFIAKKDFKKIKDMVDDVDNTLLYLSYNKWNKVVAKMKDAARGRETTTVKVEPDKLWQFCKKFGIEVSVDSIMKFAEMENNY